MLFVQNQGTDAALRDVSLKQRILAISMSTRHIEDGANSVQGFIDLYRVDGDAYTEEEVTGAIAALESAGALTVTQ